MTGRVFSIQSFCVDDGPGIRTCVYLKGCNMRCPWCHNPESISPAPEISYIDGQCVGCRACASACPAHTFESGRHQFRRDECACAGADARICPTGALSQVGCDRSAEDVVRDVAQDRRYFDRSGGGITITGGEPMVQPDFTRALLAQAKRAGLHTCVETNGAGQRGDYRAMLGYTDLFLVDYKLTDDARHVAMTGMSNRIVLGNIDWLCAQGARLVLRCPIIPGVNDAPDHYAAIAALTGRLPVLGFELMPYHPLGASKTARLGHAPQPWFAVPEGQAIEEIAHQIRSMGGREWRRES